MNAEGLTIVQIGGSGMSTELVAVSVGLAGASAAVWPDVGPLVAGRALARFAMAPDALAGYNVAMLFMVIEKYRLGPGPVYERAAAQGRLLPEGLQYVDSWVVDDERLDRCFQLMETDDLELFNVWRERWADLSDFEVFPVIKSEEAARRVGVRWDAGGNGS
jgi:hypothetical protein